jgi:hypothetical protein
MLTQLVGGLCVMAICIVIQATGMAAALPRLRRQRVGSLAFWGLCWVFIRLAGWMVLLHLGQIAVWGLVYGWRGALGDMTSALYFSAVTYTTTGYGDLLLPEEWRLVGAVEALTGILMCGWSAAFFFAVVSRVLETRARPALPTS